MTNKSLQTLVFIGAAVIALIFLKLMFDISKSMTEMTNHVGVMSQDVRKMQDSIRTMNDSIMRMEESVHNMGQAFSQGTKQFQQMNPSGIMRQMLPDSGQRTRWANTYLAGNILLAFGSIVWASGYSANQK